MQAGDGAGISSNSISPENSGEAAVIVLPRLGRPRSAIARSGRRNGITTFLKYAIPQGRIGGAQDIKRNHSLFRMCLCAILAVQLLGCGTPIQVQRADPRSIERELDRNVISSGELSEATRVVLHREGLEDGFVTDPDGAIASLHQIAATARSYPPALFALAEMSFRRAAETKQHYYFLASAIYAYAYLFPEDPQQRPSGFDRRFRTACDIYNRGLTEAFMSADRSRVRLASGRFALPFGSIDVRYDAASARWGNQVLSDFVPADELRISGLNNRYRHAGIGAPLAAEATPPAEQRGFQVEPNIKVPATAVLKIDTLTRDLAGGRLRGSLNVYAALQSGEVMIGAQPVPLEADITAPYAYGLSDPKVWENELAGFFDANVLDRSAANLVALEPYRRGQIPVIFIHGTGSSAGRWANLINDLESDPVIRDRFQFWSFTYATGNPTSYSALLLRNAIENAVHTLDPTRQDPALQNIVLIGHSQGGLLAKYLSVDSGSRLWNAISSKRPEGLQVSAETASLLRRMFFVTPLPEVRRVIFMATPHHGSFVAEAPIGQIISQLITPNDYIVSVLRDLTEDNPNTLRGGSAATPFSSSLWSMSPENPLLQAFAGIPV